ncbi:MAG: alpha/beta hydrolase-fold protein [Anaerolineales bacterium]|nr:MAG: alpha/beta hydrolase-fold protein [Anaerolineales bacterium]
MKTRQATKRITLTLTFLFGLSACAAPSQPTPTPTLLPPTLTRTPVPTFAIPTETPTVTPIACLSKPGAVEKSTLESSNPPQEFFIYLPPCYAENAEERYPVLYLLHGQTYTADQWIRLGAMDAVNKLILSGETQPFLIVFPDDHYWYTPAGTTFGARLTDELIPYIDETYRTIPDPRDRAIGGMSRGAGWALQLGLTRPELFSIVGLHSLAVFQRDASKVDDWIQAISPASRPVVFMDIGDDDQELASTKQIESIFTQFDVPHEWHLYSGDHTEEYWSAHVEEYIRWYAEQWNNP